MKTLSSRATCTDLTIYEPHPDNPDWCLFTQTGTAELKMSLFGFESKIEQYVLELYSNRYDEARKLDMIMIELYFKKKEEEKQKKEQENDDHHEKKKKKKKKKKKTKKTESHEENKEPTE